MWGNLCLSAQYALVEEEYYINAPSPMITNGSKYLLAMLNSKVVDWYIKHLGVTRNGGYFEYKPMFVELAPIPHLTTEREQEFEILVNKLSLAQNNNDKIQFEQEINNMAYSVFALTEEEINFIMDTI